MLLDFLYILLLSHISMPEDFIIFLKKGELTKS